MLFKNFKLEIRRKNKMRIEILMEMIKKSVIVKNDATVVIIRVKNVIDAKDVSYDIKQNTRKELLYVIKGDAIIFNNRYSNDKYLDEALKSNQSKKISAFVHKDTKISLYKDRNSV